MKIKSFDLTDFKPIVRLQIQDLGNTVVIAGANGSGKTRLKDAIVQTLQGSPCMDMTIVATRDEERSPKYFNGDQISIRKGQANSTLTNYFRSRKFGAGRYVGSFVQIDSNRSVQAFKYNQVNWLGGDPDDQESAGTFYFSPFTNRWQDFMNYIHQKSAARDKKLAEVMKRSPDLFGRQILEKYPDPLEKYEEIFESILPGKKLLPIDPASPKAFHFSDDDGQRLPFTALSSGEQEVIKVLFDVARKDIRHSVIIVDEPELHLHPTLAFKLIETLKNIGDHTNQFLFLTHSPDLISTYYSTGDVYFIDHSSGVHNQAHRLSDLNHEHHEVASLIGHNLGLFAVGKKLVFVEGEESSIDRLTYQKIAQTVSADIRVIPTGSVLNILALSNIEAQIRKAIFGVDLYMIRDRDGLSDQQVAQLEENGRLRCLRRRHIENYFLDAELLFRVAQVLYLTATDGGLSVAALANATHAIARESLMFNVYQNMKDHLRVNHFLRSPSVRDVGSRTPEEIDDQIVDAVASNRSELIDSISDDAIRKWLESERLRLQEKLANGAWMREFQGKYIFSRLCRETLKADPLRIRQVYVDIALDERPEAFQEVSSMFENM